MLSRSSPSNRDKAFKAYDYVQFEHDEKTRYGYISLILTTTEELYGKKSISHTLYIQEDVVSEPLADTAFKGEKADRSKVRIIETGPDGLADPVEYTYVMEPKHVTFLRHGTAEEFKRMCSHAGFPTENPKKPKATFKPKRYDIVSYEVIAPNKARKLVRTQQLAVVISRSLFPHDVVPPSLPSFQLDCVRVVAVKKDSASGYYTLVTPKDRDQPDEHCVQKIPVYSLKFIEHGVDWQLRSIKSQALRLDNPEPTVSHGPGSHRKRRIAKKTVKITAWTTGGIVAVAVGGPLVVAGAVLLAVVNFVGGIIATVTSPFFIALGTYIGLTR